MLDSTWPTTTRLPTTSTRISVPVLSCVRRGATIALSCGDYGITIEGHAHTGAAVL